MSSKAFLRDTFLYPDEEPSGTGDKVASRNKQVNIYEAVAGMSMGQDMICSDLLTGDRKNKLSRLHS